MPQFSFLSKPRAIEPAPRGPFGRTTPPTEADVRRRYERPSSFTNHLPWLDYDPEHQVFLLDDGRNVGALFEIRPAGVEARPEEWLAEFRDKIQQVLTGSVAEQQDPWVFQLFVHDEYRLDGLADQVEAYARIEIRDLAYTRHWLAVLRDHCANIARPGGLFHDDQVTGGPWQGN